MAGASASAVSQPARERAQSEVGDVLEKFYLEDIHRGVVQRKRDAISSRIYEAK